jgi:pimeloyl-ACP methyl ester carboxylesterase
VPNLSNSTPNHQQTADQSSGKQVEVGDSFITVREWPGNGPKVLLVHGIGSSWQSWYPVLAGLGASFTPITIDLHGHGDSGKPATGYLFDQYADDIDAALAANGMNCPMIIGHSLGGLATLQWAARHPARAAALVIEDSPLRSGEDFREAFDSWIAQNAMSPEDLATAYQERNPDMTRDDALRRARIMTGTAPGVFTELKADSMASHGEDRVADFVHVTSPILFLQADPDAGGRVHPDDLASFAARMPNVEIVPFPGTGHNIHAENPGPFLDYVIPFLQQHPLA